ncbi:MAG: DUF4112 domain-containing protein [Myxococcales bacterium]|nr:DUF4112 domain-containing protein [Myxococcales bacterium]
MTEPVQREHAAEPPSPYAAEIERARAFARWMDRLIGVPGSDVGIGLDAVIGLIPVGGDVIGGAASLYLVALAMKAKVPAIVIARMLLNIALDGVLGLVPAVGDLVDVFFQSNLANLKLIEQHAGGGKSTRRDWFIVGGTALLVMIVFAAPIVAMMLIGWMFFR